MGWGGVFAIVFQPVSFVVVGEVVVRGGCVSLGAPVVGEERKLDVGCWLGCRKGDGWNLAEWLWLGGEDLVVRWRLLSSFLRPGLLGLLALMDGFFFFFSNLWTFCLVFLSLCSLVLLMVLFLLYRGSEG